MICIGTTKCTSEKGLLENRECSLYSLPFNVETENVSFSFQTYRISVRTITTKGEESSDRSAVLTVGKGELSELLFECYGYRFIEFLFKSRIKWE